MSVEAGAYLFSTGSTVTLTCTMRADQYASDGTTVHTISWSNNGVVVSSGFITEDYNTGDSTRISKLDIGYGFIKYFNFL